MSYKWFKHWQQQYPGAIILIETRAGYLSYEESAFAVCRLTSRPLFAPDRKERARGLAVSVPRKEFPGLLDRLMRCRVSHLVAREDYLVYQKTYHDRFYQIYAAPIASIDEAEACRLDRPVGIDDRITVKNLETHKDCVWTLVPAEEADVAKREKSGRLSVDSPVGGQLIGCFSGEDVAVTDEDGSITKYRIMLAIDRDGRKLKKHRRAVEESEEELPAEAGDDSVPAAETEGAAEAAEEPEDAVEEPEDAAAEKPEDAAAEEPEDAAAEAEEAAAEEEAPSPVPDEAAADAEPDTAEEPADEAAADAEPDTTEEPAWEETWEDIDAATPFFRRKKVKRPIPGDPADPPSAAAPDRPETPEPQKADSRPNPRRFRIGKWFGKRDS